MLEWHLPEVVVNHFESEERVASSELRPACSHELRYKTNLSTEVSFTSIVIPELLRRCATMSGIQENRRAELKRSLDPAIKSRDDGSFLRHFEPTSPSTDLFVDV